ncbi:(d)CMP kinase [bacterium]|nr:(d)CMP kinase [bacterium]
MGKILIAIDGPAGAGKSTAARLLAEKLGYRYIDTGAMYRALALIVLRNGINWEDEDKIVALFDRHRIVQEGKTTKIDDEDVSREIRTNRVSRAVSVVCRHRRVREKMVELQRKLAGTGGTVMDGRDIGTVVLKNAQLKIFLTASEQERARRRLKDLELLGKPLPFDEVLQNIKNRDRLDSTRKIAPLKQAEDAIVVDNTDIPIDEEIQMLVEMAREAERNHNGEK